MKVCLIRHAKVAMEWPKKCNSVEFDNACMEYDEAGILEVNSADTDDSYKRIYVSNMYRSRETANRLFPGWDCSEIEVEEVPLKSFADCSLRLPLWIWNITGRLQWYANSKRQSENRRSTTERCKRVIHELECRNENCIIVSHGFFMRTFIKCLKKQGYSVSDNKIGISNLQFIYAEKAASRTPAHIFMRLLKSV